ncbi:hypothetical protein AX15_002712 [Amanita polypyramis BW_CC]|nr:hypothetical protein AX15_002712 [Amanita polypyramis BW_CC]
MPMRTRGAAALEMRSDSDVEMEEQEQEDSVEEGFDESEVDAEDAANQSEEPEEEDDEIQSVRPIPTPLKDTYSYHYSQADAEDDEPEEEETVPRLKIKLKLPTQTIINSGSATPVRGYAGPPKSSRRYRPIIPESEEESAGRSSPDISDNDQPSRSTSTPSGSTRPMTTRQAVLASVVGPSHVSLDDNLRSKKQPLNETELALRREETARKRKNLTEKKLEDEKAETINRLLKRQSRPRGRRAIADIAPQENAEDGDGDEAMEGVQQAHEEVKPVMYRWISTSRQPANTNPGAEKTMSITFSVPTIINIPSRESLEPRAPAVCAVKGCLEFRKYRLVQNASIGACGMAHLKILEGTADTMV